MKKFKEMDNGYKIIHPNFAQKDLPKAINELNDFLSEQAEIDINKFQEKITNILEKYSRLTEQDKFFLNSLAPELADLISGNSKAVNDIIEDNENNGETINKLTEEEKEKLYSILLEIIKILMSWVHVRGELNITNESKIIANKLFNLKKYCDKIDEFKEETDKKDSVDNFVIEKLSGILLKRRLQDDSLYNVGENYILGKVDSYHKTDIEKELRLLLKTKDNTPNSENGDQETDSNPNTDLENNENTEILEVRNKLIEIAKLMTIRLIEKPNIYSSIYTNKEIEELYKELYELLEKNEDINLIEQLELCVDKDDKTLQNSFLKVLKQKLIFIHRLAGIVNENKFSGYQISLAIYITAKELLNERKIYLIRSLFNVFKIIIEKVSKGLSCEINRELRLIIKNKDLIHNFELMCESTENPEIAKKLIEIFKDLENKDKQENKGLSDYQIVIAKIMEFIKERK